MNVLFILLFFLFKKLTYILIKISKFLLLLIIIFTQSDSDALGFKRLSLSSSPSNMHQIFIALYIDALVGYK